MRRVDGRVGEYQQERRLKVRILFRMALRGMERLLVEGAARGYDRIGGRRYECRTRGDGRKGR